MQKQQKRLGRGLNSLITINDQASDKAPTNQEEPASSTGQMPVKHIQPNPFQPRKDFNQEDLQSLAESIKKNGVLQPIVVRKKGEDQFELVAGERRWRAAQLAGLQEIPVITRVASDEEMLEIALVENIFRENLNAIDRAHAYKRYCDEFGLSAEEVASRLSENRTTVTNYLRLLDLPDQVKTWVAQGKLSMGHARCLLSLRSQTEINRLGKQALDQDLSVRALEKLVRENVQNRSQASQSGPPPKTEKRPQIAALEQAFISNLGTKVEINESRKKGSGKIVIHYSSLDDFDRVSEKLGIDSEKF
jgi:ParB family chromosome partitioning protein